MEEKRMTRTKTHMDKAAQNHFHAHTSAHGQDAIIPITRSRT